MQEQPSPQSTCNQCGKTSAEDARFCRHCGATLLSSEAATKLLSEDGGLAAPLTPPISPPDSNNTAEANTKIKLAHPSEANSIHQAQPSNTQGKTGAPPALEGAPTTKMEVAGVEQSGPIDPTAILNAMPVLRYLAAKKFEELGPIFENFRFIFILHFLTDIIGFMEAFRMMGMQWDRAHFLHKPYLYPYKDRIAKQLANAGADVINLTPNSLATIVGNIIAESRGDGRKIVIVEDGGYVVPLVHNSFRNELSLFQGAVEQTTKGINEDLKVQPLQFPLLSVANANIKREKESPQIAMAVWDNVKRLLFRTNRDLRNPTVLVVGFGSIGLNLANYLRVNGATVKVFDADPEKRRAAADAGYVVRDDITDLIRGEHGLVVIGATGTTSIGSREILSMDHDTLLVSASSDQREIGLSELRLLSTDYNGTPLTDPVRGDKIGRIYRIAETNNEVTILAEGYPINFWNTESMPIRVSQVAMVPLFLSTVALTTRAGEINIGEPNGEFVDRLIEEEGIYDRL